MRAAALAVASVVALSATVRLRRVTGSSMTPALRPGDVVVTLPAWLPGVAACCAQPGAVVVADDPRGSGRRVVKRVAAGSGALVEVDGGTVRVDGRTLRCAGRAAGGDVCRVPDGHAYLLGDAMAASTDSRTFGPVPVSGLDLVVAAVRHR